MDGLKFGPDDPASPGVAGLIAAHLHFSRTNSPPGQSYALEHHGLAGDHVNFFTGRLDGVVVAMGALRSVEPGHVEIKSMHTAERLRGLGVGRRMLDHLLAAAQTQGCTRVSLETGAMEVMAPARAMYAAAGFEVCPPFGDYPGGLASICMTRRL